MLARFPILNRYADLIALIAALMLIAAMMAKAPPAAHAGDARAQALHAAALRA